ncbi:hypothetical protein PENANT_c069G05384 [Penicillium antarcticum]|uniref:Uncharacterized protein n=1 Tax=Penicillium antarcticum TaxID=416450 RepID=A0A1V6PQF5_9EURO|nr:uncharacterized protein N7508_011109 [Penicillium antarcticum]KAJ5288334.1 hypothetical protein N7508_011109 [Penicillium antarcticum]OQD78967.1 hypothetical protein PENANT_c069G05384 [Penicillium antarcticum]
MACPYSRLPVENSRTRRLLRHGRTLKTRDECSGESHTKASLDNTRPLQLASPVPRYQVDLRQLDVKAPDNIRNSTNTNRQEGKMSNPVQNQLGRDCAMAHCVHAIQNAISVVEWNHQTASTFGSIIVPKPRLGSEKCEFELANGLAAMEYAINQAAKQLAEESTAEVAGQETSLELQLRARLFDFVRSHVVYSSFTSWGSARIQSLNNAFLRYLRSSPDFQNCREFRKTELKLALLFDCALQFRARLVYSGGV